MIDSTILAALCRKFHLGQALNLTPLGESLHSLWHLHTTHGDFAIKQFSKETQKSLGHYLLTPEKAESIAKWMHEREVPTVVSLSHDDGYLFSYNYQQFLVLPWVHGRVYASEQLSPAYAEQIGKCLALIHHADYQGESTVTTWTGLTADGWQQMLEPIQFLELEIVTTLTKKFDQLVDWSQQARQAATELQTTVFSHRDLDPKNVIWQNPTTPIILDWEYAGKIHPTLDLLIVALNWSDVLTGNIDFQKFEAVLKGFAKKISLIKLPLTDAIFGGYYGYCLDWLLFNLHQLHKKNNASSEIQLTLKAMEAVAENAAYLKLLFLKYA